MRKERSTSCVDADEAGGKRTKDAAIMARARGADCDDPLTLDICAEEAKYVSTIFYASVIQPLKKPFCDTLEK